MSPPTYDLEPVSMDGPTATGPPSLKVTFRLGSPGAINNPSDAIYPATALQVSLERRSDDQAIFLERLTARDVDVVDARQGICAVTVPRVQQPVFSAPPADADEGVEVRLHAWKGEKWLGSWSVGTIPH